MEGLASGEATVGESNKPETEGRSYPKRKIKIDDDFDLFHNILYYIYTDCINFASDLMSSGRRDVPKFCAPEDIYTLADRLLMEGLKTKALKFLQFTCTATNIIPRIMSKFADLHEDVANVYETYFRSNWGAIKCTAEFDQFFDDMDAEYNEISRIFEKFRKLMKDSSFDLAPSPCPKAPPPSAEDAVLQQMTAAQM